MCKIKFYIHAYLKGRNFNEVFAERRATILGRLDTPHFIKTFELTVASKFFAFMLGDDFVFMQ